MGLARLILSFKLGVKVGKGNLREASKEKLLEAGLEVEGLRMGSNGWGNLRYWGTIVDDGGVEIKERLREAVERGLVTQEHRRLLEFEVEGEWRCVQQMV